MKMPVSMMVVACIWLGSCKSSSGFQGESRNKPVQEASPLPAVQPAAPLAQPSPAATLAPLPSNIPANAVTKGSFTVWTTPTNPGPGELYVINISVRLPANTANYQVTDLSGRVNGTDGYFRGIGRDSRGALDPAYVAQMQQQYPDYLPPPFPVTDAFSVTGGFATVTLGVPGAEFLVSDEILVSSMLLNESQNLKIVFGGQSSGNNFQATPPF